MYMRLQNPAQSRGFGVIDRFVLGFNDLAADCCELLDHGRGEVVGAFVAVDMKEGTLDYEGELEDNAVAEFECHLLEGNGGGAVFEVFRFEGFFTFFEKDALG